MATGKSPVAAPAPANPPPAATAAPAPAPAAPTSPPQRYEVRFAPVKVKRLPPKHLTTPSRSEPTTPPTIQPDKPTAPVTEKPISTGSDTDDATECRKYIKMAKDELAFGNLINARLHVARASAVNKSADKDLATEINEIIIKINNAAPSNEE